MLKVLFTLFYAIVSQKFSGNTSLKQVIGNCRKFSKNSIFFHLLFKPEKNNQILLALNLKKS